jgi:hypothetical protein
MLSDECSRARTNVVLTHCCLDEKKPTCWWWQARNKKKAARAIPLRNFLAIPRGVVWNIRTCHEYMIQNTPWIAQYRSGCISMKTALRIGIRDLWYCCVPFSNSWKEYLMHHTGTRGMVWSAVMRATHIRLPHSPRPRVYWTPPPILSINLFKAARWIDATLSWNWWNSTSSLGEDPALQSLAFLPPAPRK